MPTTFHDSLADDAHDEFQKWREQNPRGFVVNRKTTVAGMLHRADCQHMGDFFWKPDGTSGLTRTEKICAAERVDLDQWAEGNRVRLTLCNDCMGG
jgi:hypothetical protein